VCGFARRCNVWRACWGHDALFLFACSGLRIQSRRLVLAIRVVFAPDILFVQRNERTSYQFAFWANTAYIASTHNNLKSPQRTANTKTQWLLLHAHELVRPDFPSLRAKMCGNAWTFHPTTFSSTPTNTHRSPADPSSRKLQAPSRPSYRISPHAQENHKSKHIQASHHKGHHWPRY
jgi:hypothetical protein